MSGQVLVSSLESNNKYPSCIVLTQVIDSLQGLVIRKVCCGSQSTLALTSSGQVYAWGCGPCLGTGSADATSAKPKLVEELQPFCIMDISVGDSHCLALTQGKRISDSF